LIPKLAPKFGLSGIREFTGQYNKPLLGCILKPKIGLNPTDYASIVKEMVDGGADIIKEDEILGSPLFCSLEDRLEIVRSVIGDKKIIYLTANHAFLTSNKDFFYHYIYVSYFLLD
jgi:ribulose-bisphosphate carboxylase large chain